MVGSRNSQEKQGWVRASVPARDDIETRLYHVVSVFTTQLHDTPAHIL